VHWTNPALQTDAIVNADMRHDSQSRAPNSDLKRSTTEISGAAAMSKKRVADELAILNRAAQALAASSDLKQIKSIRDKAEAARKYAQNAALGLQIQNQAAELKLRAERRAGELLAGLKLRGGNRKSNSHDESLKLEDLGIDHNQSARWQREAAVPETVFSQYLSKSNQLGRDITAQGLLRLAHTLSERGSNVQRSDNGVANGKAVHYQGERSGPRSGFVRQDNKIEMPDELIIEISNHRRLLEQVLRPYCETNASTLERSEKRLVLRLLTEIDDLIERLGHANRLKERL
jgi:hypothetical protein